MFVVQTFEGDKYDTPRACVGPEVEVSVVKEGTHGHKNSWGWPSDNKIILLSGDSYSENVIMKVQRLAETLARELNGG